MTRVLPLRLSDAARNADPARIPPERRALIRADVQEWAAEQRQEDDARTASFDAWFYSQDPDQLAKYDRPVARVTLGLCWCEWCGADTCGEDLCPKCLVMVEPERRF